MGDRPPILLHDSWDLSRNDSSYWVFLYWRKAGDESSGMEKLGQMGCDKLYSFHKQGVKKHGEYPQTGPRYIETTRAQHN